VVAFAAAAASEASVVDASTPPVVPGLEPAPGRLVSPAAVASIPAVGANTPPASLPAALAAGKD